MPYVHVQITREGATVEQKETLFKGMTDLLARVLNKDPATTFIVIEEVDTDNWGIAGMSFTHYRLRKQETAGTVKR